MYIVYIHCLSLAFACIYYIIDGDLWRTRLSNNGPRPNARPLSPLTNTITNRWGRDIPGAHICVVGSSFACAVLYRGARSRARTHARRWFNAIRASIECRRATGGPPSSLLSSGARRRRAHRAHSARRVSAWLDVYGILKSTKAFTIFERWDAMIV